MKQNVSGGVGIVIVVVAVLAVLFFGWKYLQRTGGGPDSGATQASIQHWQSVKENMLKHPPQSGGPGSASTAASGGIMKGSGQ